MKTKTSPEDPLQGRATLQEQPFHSTVPLLGPLIVRFRAAWNSVATKWYVRAILQQQNEFNQLLVARLEQTEAQLLEQDRHQAQLTRQVAALTAQVVQLNRLLEMRDGRAGNGE